MTTLQRVLEKLPGAKKSGNRWWAKCPAHDDHNAGLSVSEASDGTALVKCHAGCGTVDILAKIDLTLADLFPPKSKFPAARRAVSRG